MSLREVVVTGSFNTSLLAKKDFVEYMNDELGKSIQSTQNKKPGERWEIIKRRVKEKSLQYSRAHAAQEYLVIGQLSEKVNEYEASFPLLQDEEKLYRRQKMNWKIFYLKE